MNTPYYEFNLSTIEDNYNCLLKTIHVDKLFYALKANGEKNILRKLNSIGACFEIASIGEFKLLEEIGVKSDRIICSLPIKTVTMIEFLYSHGVNYFVFDSLPEYYKIKKIAPNSKKIMRLYINDIADYTIEFGMKIEELTNELKKTDFEVDGVTFYLSKNKNISYLKRVLNRCQDALSLIGHNKILNIGGNYRLPHEVSEDYYHELNTILHELKNKTKCIIYAEPGRSIVKSAGQLITTVIAVKKNSDTTYVYIDGGLPTGISYAPTNITFAYNKHKIKNTQRYQFYDITCSHRMLFDISINYNIEVNDILIFNNFGSYSVAKYSNFHGWEKPYCKYI